MRAPMRGNGSPYEVRCHRCDVSFPIETRRCIHCGGPTAASDAGIVVGAFPGPIEVAPARDAGVGSTSPAGGPLETEGDDAPSLPATLLRSFGSLIWVFALVAFTLLRNCQSEP